MIEEYVKTLNQSFTKFSSFLPLLNSVLEINISPLADAQSSYLTISGDILATNHSDI